MSNASDKTATQPKEHRVFGDDSHEKGQHTAACASGCIPTDARAGDLLSYIKDYKKDKVIDDPHIPSHFTMLLPDAYKNPAEIENAKYNACLVITGDPPCELCRAGDVSYVFENREEGPVYQSGEFPLDFPGLIHLYQVQGEYDGIQWHICRWRKLSKVCMHNIKTIPSQCLHVLNQDPLFRARLDDQSYQDMIKALNALLSSAGREPSELDGMTAGQVIRPNASVPYTNSSNSSPSPPCEKTDLNQESSQSSTTKQAS
ncbi:MAG: hypothetical protein Q9187_001525 [Circinaria calcarea]